MAIEQGFIFKFAQHHEFLTSFWNVGENGHSTSTVLGLTSQKSNSQPQNGRHGVFIPFQPISVGRPLELDIKCTETGHCKRTFGIRHSMEFGIRPLEIGIINSVR